MPYSGYSTLLSNSTWHNASQYHQPGLAGIFMPYYGFSTLLSASTWHNASQYHQPGLAGIFMLAMVSIELGFWRQRRELNERPLRGGYVRPAPAARLTPHTDTHTCIQTHTHTHTTKQMPINPGRFLVLLLPFDFLGPNRFCIACWHHFQVWSRKKNRQNVYTHPTTKNAQPVGCLKFFCVFEILGQVEFVLRFGTIFKVGQEKSSNKRAYTSHYKKMPNP